MIVIAMLVGLIGAAVADTYEPTLPPFPDPRFVDPQLLVTPSDNLTSGQTVSVTGRRFGANVPGGTLRQCTADLALCESPSGSFTTGANGEFNPINAPNTPEEPQTIPVNFVVRSTFTATNGTMVNCRVTPCVIFASATSGPETRSAAHHISFAPEVTTTTSTSTTLPPTTTSTSTTLPPTTTSTSTSTSTTMATTTTTMATTTTTIRAPIALVCEILRAQRAAINAQLNAARAAHPAVSTLIEAYRTLINARIDQELAARGCTTGGA